VATTSTPLQALSVFFLSSSPPTPYLPTVVHACVPCYIRKETHAESTNLLHFTSLEVDDINQHSITFVQTTLKGATSYNKTRYSKVGNLYRKYTNEGTEKNSNSDYSSK
jgi:hypothetical protein